MDWVLWGLAVALLGLHLASCLIVACRRKSSFLPWVGTPPRITLLRPACGVDALDEETLGSGFAIDYPCLDLVFCVADPADPVVPLIERLMAAHPGVPARLLLGEDAISANPKLNNLAKGWNASDSEWVIMADSNLALPRDYIWRLLEVQGTDVGLVSSPPVGVRPQGVWAALECAFLNGNQARLQLAADSLGFGFAQGKTMMWRRAFLDQNRGLAALGNKLAEDVAATHLVRSAGLRVALPHRPFAQPIGRRSLGQVWARQLRWSKVRRDGFGWLFALEPLNGATVAVGMAALAGGIDLAVLIAALWYAAEAALSAAEGWITSWTEVLLFPLRDALLPLIWIATLRNKAFDWRGNAMAPGSLNRLPG